MYPAIPSTYHYQKDKRMLPGKCKMRKKFFPVIKALSITNPHNFLLLCFSLHASNYQAYDNPTSFSHNANVTFERAEISQDLCSLVVSVITQ